MVHSAHAEREGERRTKSPNHSQIHAGIVKERKRQKEKEREGCKGKRERERHSE